MEESKRCSKCRETKSHGEFPRDKRRADGLFPYCKACKSRSDREYRERHLAVVKARRRKRYYEDPARAVAEAIAWNKANPDRRKVINAKWQRANLDGKVRESVRRRYATRKGAPSIHFTPEQLAQRAAYYGGLCWLCRAPFTEWDHVKPLTKGGWHCLSNLRPICRTCNARKRNTWPFVA